MHTHNRSDLRAYLTHSNEFCAIENFAVRDDFHFQTSINFGRQDTHTPTTAAVIELYFSEFTFIYFVEMDHSTKSTRTYVTHTQYNIL